MLRKNKKHPLSTWQKRNPALFFLISLSFISTMLPDNISQNISFEKIADLTPIHELQRKLAHNPNDFTIHFQLGNEFYKAKLYNEAIIHYKKALQKKPTHINALYNLGLTYLDCENRLEQAKQAFIKITQLTPKNHQAFYKIALIFEQNKEIENAIIYYKKAIEANPQCIPAHTKLGLLYNNTLQNHEQALFHLKTALSLTPKNETLMFLIGNILNNIGSCKEAAQFYLKAAKINPQNHAAIYNAGYSLKVHGDVDKAIKLYKMALTIKPDYESARYAMALAHLYNGNFENGWHYYKERLIREKRNAPKLRQYIKTGDLKNKKIYLAPEGGLGDTMQFIRYAKVLNEMGAYVMVSVQSPLYKLIANCPFIDQLIPPGRRPETFDDYASIMSLPAIFTSTEETIPKDIPYIFPDKTLEEKWRSYFNKKDAHKASQTNTRKTFKIGLCWQADLKNDVSRALCAHRSIPLEKLEKLSLIPNIEFYSLQKDIDPEDIKHLPDNFVIQSFGPDFDNTAGPFMDTAAIMKQLDLIISVDTSIVHLAGAVGAPVWVMLPYNTDWRWIVNREDSPWYPTMKIFKQPKAFDWDSVVENMFQELVANFYEPKNSQND